MRAFYIDSSVPVSNEVLGALGVSVATETDMALSAYTANYPRGDEVKISRESLGADYDNKMAIFFTEHIHEDDEVRYVIEGTGHFDVRDKADAWIRIAVEPQGKCISVGFHSPLHCHTSNHRQTS